MTIQSTNSVSSISRASRFMRKAGVVALVAASLVSLASCGGAVPVPQAQSDTTALPVMSQEREQIVREKILQSIYEADAAKNVDALKARMDGPALRVRESQLKIAASTNNLDTAATIPTSLSQSIITTSKTWPRTIYAITTVTDDQQSQRLLVLNQSHAADNYKIWSLVRLFSGVQMPAFNVATIGSEQGDAKTQGLVATPEDVVKQYADVLEKGSSSEFASKFADDQLRKQLETLTQNVQSAISQNEGTQSQKFRASVDNIKVLRTADGGALIVAEIGSVWTRTAGNSRQSLPASDSEKVLFGNTTATSTLEVTYVNEVAFYVPPAGSSDVIRAVGAERQPISVVTK